MPKTTKIKPLIWSINTISLILLLASPVSARRRPRFEPTDLELERPGIAEVDLQFGATRNGDDWRIIAPDFEIDIGLTENIELDIDGALVLAKTATDDSPTTFSPDNLWISTKIGLIDFVGEKLAGAIGIQLGPRLAIYANSDGPGYEILLLGGLVLPRTHLVLNIGAFVDPAPAGATFRPAGLNAGVDLSIDLDRAGRFTFDAAVFATLSLSPEPSEAGVTAGFTWSATSWLDLSATVITGSASGQPLLGGLLGVAPKFALWHPKVKNKP